jgi:hypothetical protein
LAETVVISEDMIAGGTLITDNMSMSDISNTPSNFGNGKHYFVESNYSFLIYKSR